MAEDRAAEEGGGERAKDRSALRRFSPLVVKPGYKAQRDGLGKSCARCACLAHLFVLFFFLLLSFLLSSPRGMARLFSMRQFNDAMQPRLFAVAGEKREPEGGSTEGLARLTLSRRRGCAQISCGRANISHPWEEER